MIASAYNLLRIANLTEARERLKSRIERPKHSLGPAPKHFLTKTQRAGAEPRPGALQQPARVYITRQWSDTPRLVDFFSRPATRSARASASICIGPRPSPRRAHQPALGASTAARKFVPHRCQTRLIVRVGGRPRPPCQIDQTPATGVAGVGWADERGARTRPAGAHGPAAWGGPTACYGRTGGWGQRPLRAEVARAVAALSRCALP